MKIAIIRQRYNPFGGAERFVERTLAGLERSDLDVTLITRRWDGPAGSYQRLICDPFYMGSTWRDAGFARAACDAAFLLTLATSGTAEPAGETRA